MKKKIQYKYHQDSIYLKLQDEEINKASCYVAGHMTKREKASSYVAGHMASYRVMQLCSYVATQGRLFITDNKHKSKLFHLQ